MAIIRCHYLHTGVSATPGRALCSAKKCMSRLKSKCPAYRGYDKPNVKRLKAFVLLKQGKVVDITQYTTATGMIMFDADQILECTVTYKIPSVEQILKGIIDKKPGMD